MIAQERIVTKLTWMLPGIEHFSYEDRLGLFSIEQTMLVRDLIEVYNIMRDLDGIE